MFLMFSTWLNIKKIFGMQVVTVTVFALVVGFAVGAILAQDGAIVSINVGVLYHEAHHFADLQARVQDNPFVTFVSYTDRYLLEQDILAGVVTIGYVLAESFQYLGFGQQGYIITQLTSPRTIAAPIINEIVAASALYASLEDITAGALVTHFPNYQPEQLAHFAHTRLEFYRCQDIFMIPIFHSVDAYIGMQYVALESRVRIVHGIIGIYLLAVAIFLIPAFIEEKTRGVLVPLAHHNVRGTYYLSLIFSVALVLFSIGACGNLVLAIFDPNIFRGVYAFVALFFYSVSLSFIMVGAVYVLKTSLIVQNFGIFIIICNIFFGGMLLNLYEIAPGIAVLQYFSPLFWYIQFLL
ncbi:MAG: hypothetical protein FWG63_02000 [Defluviitaleaceae bacterium]|nr:hypothetical protein [Defluviitaleaceae bacterium]